MKNKELHKKAYEEAKKDTLKKYPKLKQFFDLLEDKLLYNSGEESPLTSEQKGEKTNSGSGNI